jgi:hypothetical protein
LDLVGRFQFYKSDCHKFEVCKTLSVDLVGIANANVAGTDFMVEKVLLVGFTQMFGELVSDSTGLSQWLMNMTVTIFFLVLVAVRMPSTEPRYNAGNIAMHVLVIYFVST